MSDITLESVSKHYTTEAGVVRAVDGVTIDIDAGSSVAIHGSERLREVDVARADRRPRRAERRTGAPRAHAPVGAR